MSTHQEFLETISGIASGYMRAQILFAANENRIFGLLESPCDAETVANETGWSLRGARMLLDGLVAIELAEKTDGAYRNAPIASACLAPGSPYYQGNILRHNHNGYASWARLQEALQLGTTPFREHRERSQEELENFILRAYLASAGANASFLPTAEPHTSVLLDAFVVDKALYELSYEINSRPAWVRIPLLGLQAILG